LPNHVHISKPKPKRLLYKKLVLYLARITALWVVVRFHQNYSLSFLKRERDVGNVSDRSPFLIVSELFWSLKGHKRLETLMERSQTLRQTVVNDPEFIDRRMIDEFHRSTKREISFRVFER
jgi:hypothetical protein